MKTILLKTTLIICIFGVFSCKKTEKTATTSNNNNNNTNPSQPAGRHLATYKNNYAKYFFFYNADSQLIACSLRDTSGKTFEDSLAFQYNKAGQLITVSKCFQRSNTPFNMVSFFYSPAGILTSDIIHADSIPFDLYDNYSFGISTENGKNILVDSSFSLMQGTSNFITANVLTYDSNNNVIDTKSYTGDSSLKYEITFGYDNKTSFQNNLPLAFRIFFNSWNFDLSPDNNFNVIADYSSWDVGFASNHNNIVSVNVSGSLTQGIVNQTNTYTYNSQGLPVTETSTSPGQATQHITYTYR